MKKSDVWELLIVTGIAAAVSVLSVWASFLVVIVPVAVAYLGIRQKAALACVPAVVSIGIFALFGGVWAGAYAAVILPVAVFLIWAQKNRKFSAYEGIVLSALGCFIAMAALVLAIYLITGEMIVDYLLGQFFASLEASPEAGQVLYGMMSQDYAGMLTKSSEQIIQYFSEPSQTAILQDALRLSIPVSMMTYTILGGIINYLIVWGILKKRGARVVHVPPFSRWALPKKIGIYALVLYILSLIPQVFQIEGLMLPGIVLGNTVELVFMTQGLAIVDFLLRRGIPATAPRVILLVLICVLGWMMVPLVFTILMWLGLLDQLFHFRDRMISAG